MGVRKYWVAGFLWTAIGVAMSMARTTLASHLTVPIADVEAAILKFANAQTAAASFVKDVKAGSESTAADKQNQENLVKLAKVLDDTEARCKSYVEARKGLEDSMRALRSALRRPGPRRELRLGGGVLARAELRMAEDRGEIRDQLCKILSEAPLAYNTFFEACSKRLSPAKAIDPRSQDGVKLLTDTAAKLPDLTFADGALGQVGKALADSKEKLKKGLDALSCKDGDLNKALDRAESSFKQASSDAAEVRAKLGDIFDALINHLNGRIRAIELLLPAIEKQPRFYISIAQARKAEELKVQGLYMALLAAWTEYEALLKTDKKILPPPNLEVLRGKIAAIRDGQSLYEVEISAIEVATRGTRADFITSRVDLFYNRDVQRLMALIRGEKNAEFTFANREGDLASIRDELINTQFNIEAATATLNQEKTNLQEIMFKEAAPRAEQKQAEEDLRAKEEALRKQRERVIKAEGEKNQRQNVQTSANDRHVAAVERLRKAEELLAANPTDQLLKKALDDARSDEEQTRGKLEAATQQVTQAETRLQQERARETSLQADRDAASEKVEGAKKEIAALAEAKKRSLENMRTAATTLASARQSQAVKANDESVLFANLRDNAPMLYALGDQASLDPLRRVSLFGFKDGSAIILYGSEFDVAKVEEVVGQFDAPRPQARLTLWTMQVNVVQDTSGRDNLNKAFQVMEDRLGVARRASAAALSILRDSVGEKVTEATERGKNAIRSRGNGAFSGLSLAEKDQLARMWYYEPSVARRLGFDENRLDYGSIVFALRHVPDPARITSFGEALFVLALGPVSDQRKVIASFEKRLRSFFNNEFSRRPDSRRRADGADWIGAKLPKSGPLLSALRRSLDLDDTGPQIFGNAADQMTPIQAELVLALERKIGLDVFNELIEKSSLRAAAGMGKTMSLDTSLAPKMAYISSAFQVDPPNLLLLLSRGGDALQSLKNKYPRTWVNARIAVADEMLKKIVTAMEEDLDELIIRPTVYQIREDMRKQRLDVGVLQRTSVIASNRFPARVDAGASATLAMGTTTDVLAGSIQLAQIAAAASGANPAGMLKELKSLFPNSIQPPQEFYGITSGGVFNVTPVFEPSGQSLRFTFDYLLANRVRDPDQTTNASLPRIERHTVNTEVQLGNFELREISRFEANTKLGLPTQKWGGIPILGDIYPLSELPLIGWFVKKQGRAAVTQHSLLLGQTTIYPTIGDLVRVLSPAASEAGAIGK